MRRVARKTTNLLHKSPLLRVVHLLLLRQIGHLPSHSGLYLSGQRFIERIQFLFRTTAHHSHQQTQHGIPRSRSKTLSSS